MRQPGRVPMSPQQFNAQRLAQLGKIPGKRLTFPPASKLTIARYATDLIAIAERAYAIVLRTVIAAINRQQALATVTLDESARADARMTTREKIKAFLTGKRAANRAIRAAAQNVPHTPAEKEALTIPADIDAAIADMEAQIAKLVAGLGNPSIQIGAMVEDASAVATDKALTQLGLKVIEPQSELASLATRWTQQNASLIKSIPTEMAERVRQKVAEMVPQGARWETISAQLQKEEGIGKRRAHLIARDQVGKYNAALRDARTAAAGIDTDAYEWSGAQDNRERDSHLALQGQRFNAAHPSPIGDPGTAPLCRCEKQYVLNTQEKASAQGISKDALAQKMASNPREDDPPDLTHGERLARAHKELAADVKMQDAFKASRMV